MRSFVLVSSVVLVMACGSAEPVPDTPAPLTDPDTPVSSSDVGGEPVHDEPPPAGPCSAGGVPDDGDAQGCDFRVMGCCYESADAACTAAGCALSSCAILESYPAQVRCE